MTAAKRNSDLSKNSQFQKVAVVGLGCSYDQTVEIADLWRFGPDVDALSDFQTNLHPLDKLASAIASAVLDAEPLSSQCLSAGSTLSIALVDTSNTIDGAGLAEHLRVRLALPTDITTHRTLTEAIKHCGECLYPDDSTDSVSSGLAIVAACDKRAIAIALTQIQETTVPVSPESRVRNYAVISSMQEFPKIAPTKAIEKLIAANELEPSEIEMIQVARVNSDADNILRFEPEIPETSLGPLQTIGLAGGDTTALECLVSVAFSLYHKVLVPSRNTKIQTNQRREQEVFPWVHGQIHRLLPDDTRKKLSAHLSRGRFACLLEDLSSSTNTILLEELEDAQEVTSPELLKKWDSELILIVASTHIDLANSCVELLRLLDLRPDLSLLSIAQELADRFKSTANQGARAAIVASSVGDLKAKLRVVFEAIVPSNGSGTYGLLSQELPEGVYVSSSDEIANGKTAFLLPGLGAAYPNMLSDLCVHFPEVRAAFDFVDHLARVCDYERNEKSNPSQYPSRRIFSQAGSKSKTPETAASLATMDSAVVTVLMGEWALFKLFHDLGVAPDVLVGISTGEFAALSMCGTTDILDTAGLFYRLSTAVARSVPQDQLSNLRSICVYADYDSLKEHLSEFQSVYLSADFAPSQFILSGDTNAIEEVTKRLTGLNKTVHRLPVAIPYHTPLVEGKIDTESNELVQLELKPPSIETWCCSIAGPLPADSEFIKGMTTDLFTHPIRLKETVRKLYDSGVTKFVEMGPRGNLTPFVAETLEGKPHLAISANTSRGSALTQFLNVLAALTCLGAPLNPDLLFVRRRPRFFPSHESRREPSDLELGNNAFVAEDAGEALVLANYMAGLAAVHTRMVAVQKRAMETYLDFVRAQDAPLTDVVNEGPADEAVPSFPRPFLHGARVKRSDNTISCEIFLSPTIHKFLTDHAIGGEVLSGLEREKVYLVPLTVMLEIMAEVAAELFDGLKVIGISNVRALKRIRVGASGVSLSVRAKAQQIKDGRTALVEILDEDVLAKCEVTFAEQYQAPPTPQIEDPKDGRASAIQKLYGEGSMFHGPRMQAVRSIDSVGTSEIKTTFELTDNRDWFSFTERPQFEIDPNILDNGTQLTLYFLLEHNKSTNALLPFMLERLSLYASPGRYTGSTVLAGAKMRQASSVATEADIEILSPDGSVMYKFHGLSSRRICLPDKWNSSVQDPASSFFSERLQACEANLPDSIGLCVSQLDGSCLPEEEVARTWCLDYVLHPKEFPQYHKLNGMRRREWLLGRIAAKDSVRRLVQSKYGLTLTCADVIIENLQSGQPIATGHWKSALIDDVHVSLSHKGDIAVAAAACGTIAGAGIDIEEIQEREDGFEDLAFNSEDVALLVRNTHSPLGRHKIATIMWSAKESVGKALGMNLGQQRLSLTITSLDLHETAPSKCIVSAKRSDSGTSTHTVTCTVMGDLVVAVTVNNAKTALSSH